MLQAGRSRERALPAVGSGDDDVVFWRVVTSRMADAQVHLIFVHFGTPPHYLGL